MNTQNMTPAEALDRLALGYAPSWTLGVLVDHLGLATDAGLVVRTTARREYVTGPKGGRALPVLCGDLVWIDTEDGRTDSRCGLPVAAGRGACDRHADERDDWYAMAEAEKIAWERDPARAW